MTSNKLVFGIGTMLVLMTTLFLNVPSKVAFAQQQPEQGMMATEGEEMSMMPMDKMMSKEMMQKMIDKMKEKYPMHAEMLNKIQNMTLEDTVKNLFGLMKMEHLLKIHAMHLVESKSMMGSNQTMMMK